MFHSALYFLLAQKAGGGGEGGRGVGGGSTRAKSFAPPNLACRGDNIFPLRGLGVSGVLMRPLLAVPLPLPLGLQR